MSGKQNGFSKIPLARKIEALVLTAVTVIASASVDWSSLTARAEDTYPYDGSLTTMVELDQSNPVIKREVIGKGGNQADNTPMYLGIHSAYMNVQLSEGATAHYEVAIYQNYADDADYTTATSVRSGNEIASGDLTQYDNVITLWDWPDDKNALVYLASGEKATIEVTFSNISDGAVISYGQDSESNPIAIGTKYEDTFSDAELVSENGRTSYVAVTNGNAIDFTNDFSLSPSYKRNIYYKLAVGEPDNITDVTSIASSSGYTATSHASIAVDDTQKLLTPGTESGVDTLLVFSGNDSSKWLKIPVRIVAPNINYTGLTYDGNSVSIVTPSCGPNVLIEGTDFFATYSGEDKQGNHYNDDVASNIRNAGDYTVTLTGAAGTAYEGLSYSETFSIAPKDIKEVATESDMQVDPAALSVTNADGALTDNGQNLIKDYDYTVDKVERDAADNAKYSITITGKGNYTGTRVIQSSNSLSGTVDLNTLVNKLMLTRAVGNTTDGAVYVFDAAAHNEPGIYFYDLNNTRLNLKLHDDYEYAIRDNSTQAVVYDSVTPSAITYAGAVNAGNYTVEIRGRGNYTGTIKSTDFSDQVFQIQRRPLTYNNFIVKISPVTFVADDTVHQPTSVTAEYRYGTDGAGRWTMRQGVDYNYAFDQTKDANTYAVKIIPLETGNFSGETKDFTNHQQAAAGTAVAVLDANPDLVHPESVYKYEIIASLDKAEVCLTDGNIFPDANVANAGTSWFSDYSAVYDGNAKQPKVQVKIGAHELSQYVNDTTTPNADYKVIYDPTKETNVGEASLIIQGMNKFEGQPILTVKYTITPISLAAGDLTVSKEKTYDPNGKAATLANGEYSVSHDKKSLSEGTDFVLEYENNTDQGDATVTAKGIGNYTGSAIAVMKINPFDFTKSTDFTIKSIPDQSYTGSEIKPDEKGLVVVQYKGWKTLEKDVDYKVTYEKGTNIKTTDKAKVIITGLGNYTGVKYTTFRIKTKSLLDGVTYRIGGTKTGTLSGTTNTGYTEEYTGKPSTPNIELNNGALRNGVDYTVSTSSAIRAGKRTITITGIGNYAGTEAKLVYVVIPKALTSAKAVPVASGASTSGAIQTGTDAIKRYYKVQIGSGSNVLTLTPASITYNADGTAASVTDSGDYTFQWTQPDGTELAENQIPSIAGEGYTLKITGHGNYSGSVSIVRDGSAAKNKLMVGASVDAVDVIDILDRSGDSVPYLGSNLPAVYLESGKLTSKTSSVNPYNQNIVVSGNSIALAGPDYENGQYQNGTAKDYTVHFVPGTTASKDDAAAELSSLPVNTQFKVRVSAVAGSKLFFGSHQTERVFTVSATDLSDFGKKTTGKTTDYRAGKLTVSDPAAAAPYVVSNGSVVSAAAISYEYTGSTITPKLSVTFTPVTPDSSKFNGTFAPINLLSYATVAPATIPADVKKNQNFTLTANTGSGFSGTLTIPYEVTQKKITEDMIKMSPTSATYNGSSQKNVIDSAVTVTYNNKPLTKDKDYTLSYFEDADGKTSIDPKSGDFTKAQSIYIQVSGTGTNFDTTPVMYPDPFVIKGKSLSSATLTLGGDVTKPAGSDIYYAKYNGGKVVSPSVIVMDNGKTLSGTSNKSDTGKDYYYDPTSADSLTQTGGVGLKTVTVKGLNNYSGDADLTESFYVYGTLTKVTNSTDADAFTTSDIADGKQLILDENGNTVTNDGTKSAFDYTKVVFKHGTDSLTYGTHFTAVLKRDGVPVSDMSVPGIYTITYTGTGYRNGCYGTVIFNNITVKGDLQYATIVGSKDNLAIDGRNYDFAGKGNNPGPQNIGHVTVKLGSYNIPGEALKFSVASIDNRDYVPGDGADATITIEPNTSSTKYGSLYTGSVSASYNIRYDLSKVTISKKSGETLSMTDDVDILKSKIVVTWKGQTLTQDTDYTFDPQPSWTSTGSNATPRLTFTLQPDANLDHSYGSKSSTALTGTRKPLNKDTANVSMTTPQSTNTQEYDGQDHFNDFAGNVEITYDGETLHQGTDYAVQVTKQGSSTSLKAGDMVNVGTYVMKIRGLGNYKTDTNQEITAKYEITQQSLSGGQAELTDPDDNQLYYANGKKLQPEYTVTDSQGNTLTKDKDYTIDYSTAGNAWNAEDTVTVTITGKGNYKDTISPVPTFQIQAVDLSSTLIKATSTAEYNGEQQTPDVTVERVDSDGKVLATLNKGTDYTFNAPTDSDLKNVGSHTCSISAGTNKNYTGTKDFEFIITPRSLTSSGIEVTLDKADGKYAYANGGAVTPTVTITDTGLATSTTYSLVSGTDYTATPANNTVSHSSDNTDGAAPVVQIVGNNNYGGEVDRFFQIGTDLSDATVSLSDSTHGYDGEAFRPTVTGVTLNGNALTETTDYTGPAYTTTGGAVLAATEPTAKGTYKATVTGTGAYFGTASAEYTITAQNASRADIIVEFQSDSAMQTDDSGAPFWYYTGEAITPAVKVYYSPDDDTKTELTGGDADSTTADYYLTYSSNVNAGEEASITVHLINNYAISGTEDRVATFTIKPVDIKDFSLTLNGGTKADFDGTAQTKAFTLSGKNPAGQTVSKVYSGTAVQIETEAANDGLNVDWTNNIAPGTANLQVSGTGNGNYTGTAPLATMTIVGVISDATITVARSTNIQAKVTPKVTVDFKDKSGTSHIIDPDSGWYDVTYRADTGNWKTATKVEVTVKGVEPLLGMTYITGTKKAYGELTDEPTGLFLTGYNATYQYTGQPISPSGLVVSGSAMQGGNISVVGFIYHSDKDDSACIIPGTVTMSAIVSYTDSTGTTKTTEVSEDANGNQAKFRILKRSLKSCDIIGPVDVRYNGSAQEPVVSISADGNPLTPGKDYKITGYVNNTKPGTATVSITAGDNGYVSGKTSKTFTIFVANVTGLTATSVSTTSAKISWSASPSVDGYLLTYENTKGVQKVQTKNLTYTVTDLPTDDSTQVAVQAFVNEGSTPTYFGDPNTIFAKTALTATTTTGSSSGGRNTVRWSTVSGANGYEIWRATRKDGTYELLTTATASATSYTDSHATVGTTYYYKVRAYKISTTAGSTFGQKYGYSNFSNSVAIMTVN